MPEAAAAAKEISGCEYIMSDMIGGSLLTLKKKRDQMKRSVQFLRVP